MKKMILLSAFLIMILVGCATEKNQRQSASSQRSVKDDSIAKKNSQEKGEKPKKKWKKKKGPTYTKVKLAEGTKKKSDGYYNWSGSVMGTSLHITVAEEKAHRFAEAVKAAVAEIRRIENMMTDWKDDSQLMAINHQAGVKAAAIPPELEEVLLLAKRVGRETHGAFDISFASVGKLWDFKARPFKIPSQKEIDRAVKLINYKKLVIDTEKHTAYLPSEEMRIGLGGIAKGYGVDRAMAVLKERGVKNAVVNAGGDLTVIGTNHGKPWLIGIRRPDKKGDERVVAVIPLDKGSVVTSGNYERYGLYKGKRYTHIIHPKTGWPVEGVKSVTVLAPTAAYADALATGLFVLGPKEGMICVNMLPEAEAIMIDWQDRVYLSRGLRKKKRSWEK